MIDYKERSVQYAERINVLLIENNELKRRLEGNDSSADSYLQMKADRQRKALDRLNRKVLTQRFRLNLLSSLGRDVTREEYIAARDAAGNARIEEFELV